MTYHHIKLSVPFGGARTAMLWHSLNSYKKALQNEIKLNKGYKGMSRNCSTFAREGVRAVSDKEIKGEESFLGKSYVTPNKLFEDTKMLPNTDVLVDPGQKTKYEFKSVIKAVIKHAMKP